MKTQNITRESLRAWGACWLDEDIADVIPVGGVTIEELFSLRRVPLKDKVWVLAEQHT